MKQSIIKIRKGSLVGLTVAFVVLFSSCEKEDTAKGGQFDGSYSGQALFRTGEEAGEWDMDIDGEDVKGDYTQDGYTYPFNSTIDDDGNIKIFMNMEDNYSVTARLGVMLSDHSVVGSWEDNEGDGGSLVGKKKGTGSAGNGSSNSCGSKELIGHWYTSSGNVDIQFTSSCTGTLHYKDANNTPGCESGSVTKFEWSTSGNILSLDYTSMTVCGEKRNPDNDDPKQFSVSGDKLTWAGATWTKK